MHRHGCILATTRCERVLSPLLQAAEEALAGTTSAALLQKVMGGDKPSAVGGDGTGSAGDASAGGDGEPPWCRAARALMFEGLAYIERMCSLGSTAERRSLLGSAYKRRAWTGLGESRRDDLLQAANNYAAAHAIEVEEGRDTPSPYARLNQLTLEMLAGE